MPKYPIKVARLYLFLVGISYVLLGLLLGVALNTKREGNFVLLLLAVPAAIFTTTLSLISDVCSNTAVALGCESVATVGVGMLVLIFTVGIRKSSRLIYPLYVLAGVIFLSGVLDGLKYELFSVVNAGLFVFASLVLTRDESISNAIDA